MNFQTSTGTYPSFSGNNPAPSGNPNGKPPKRTPIACVKCRDRKIKCIPGPSQSPPCTRCREQNQECVYLSVAEHTQQRSQASPEPTDVYPPYEQVPMNHPPPPAPPHYPQPQSPSSMAPTYSHSHQPPPNQPYQVSAYQNVDHQNTAASGVFLPPNGPPAFSYGPPVQNTPTNYGGNPYFDSAYQGQPYQGQPIRVQPTRAQSTRGPPIQGLPNHQMPMGGQQNNGSFNQPPFYYGDN